MDEEETILNRIISACGNEVYNPKRVENPDYSNPSGISIGDVKDIIKLLLDFGAHPDFFCPNGVTPLTDIVLIQESELAELLLEYGADAAIDCYAENTPSAWNYAEFDGFNVYRELGAREVFYAMVRHRSTPAFTQQLEDKNRQDAFLPDEQ